VSGVARFDVSRGLLSAVLAAMLLAASPPVPAARISDVSSTKHNLSASGPGPVKADSESQICVFCHTPHAAENEPGAPLWNRDLAALPLTYTPYTSNTIDASDITATPGGSSKLCLSCHDGTLAIGAVNVANGQADVTIAMQGTEVDGTMPGGPSGELSGFTRRLGVDLDNDHPISFTYDATLATADGELRNPDLVSHIATRVPGVSPAVPLENDKLECTSCHDPHIRDDTLGYSIKFLRLNRFQILAPSGSGFSEANDQVCLACHDKLGTAWSQSAHADQGVANELYKDAAATTREFFTGIRVWEAACLNCHDTHTVQGARRLLREGTDTLGSPKSGGDSAIEETCYQCHTTSAESILQSVTEVPNVKTDFQSTYHMPITKADQDAGEERHDPHNADGEEIPDLLGLVIENRHAECTDCHNPHRVMKNSLFNGTGDPAAGTHDHASGHSNIASGVLRGAWGVEPLYGGASFQDLPTGYELRTGDGGLGAGDGVGQPYVTREYQICLKCHSDYGYADNNIYPTGNRPNLGISGGSTDLNTNGLTQYTNQAKEFQAPLTHKGEPIGVTGSGAGSAYEGGTQFNHRSWHPVMDSTGRTALIRNLSAAAFLAPFNGAIGTQTMYCSDCHGSNTANNTVVPGGTQPNGNPWGPHGSTNPFLLKGTWDQNTGGEDKDVPVNDPDNGLCFKCHRYQTYADRNGDNNDSGFSGGGENNLHAVHADRVGKTHCMWCHVAVPHGWKNKALLVNLNDVGTEAGLAAGTEISIGGNNAVYNQEPYYRRAKLKILTFRESGSWQQANCGSASGQGGTGGDWMKNVCDPPP
jgi:hypothetical protein